MDSLVELRSARLTQSEPPLPLERPPSTTRSSVGQRVRRLAVLAAERFVAPTPEAIQAVNLAITYYCNSRCKMCSIWEIYKKDRTRAASELSLADIQKIFSSRHFNALRSLSLTGGEPFLRRDLVDIAGFFLTQFPAISLVIPTDSVSPKLTVGTVRKLVERHRPGASRLAISVSLDGLRESHDRQRGVPCFDKALEVLTDLAPLDLNLNVSFTITSLNSADLLATYRLARSFGASFNCQFAQVSANYYGDNSSALRPLDESEVQQVGEQISVMADDRWSGMSAKSRLTDTNDYYLRRMADYQKAPRRIFTCFSGTHSCFIDPYGDVFPCIMLDKKLGNAKQQGFDAVWEGEAASEVRRSVAANSCHCWTPCEAAPSLGRSLDPIPSLAHLAE